MPQRTNKSIRIQLIEEHEVARVGFRHVLESEDDMEVVAESASALQACRDYDRNQPDVLVTGLSLPDMSALEIIRHILGFDPQARIIVLSMHSGLVVDAALQLGVRGFVSKKSGAQDLIMTIRKVMQGEYYIDPESAARLKRTKARMVDASLSNLTRQEMEIFGFLADGQSVSGIAGQMQLSTKTIYTHRANIMNKLGVKSTTALAKIAFDLDLFTNAQ